jgi:antitoxin component YwqK of YwqJK toxin-antitoxin module
MRKYKIYFSCIERCLIVDRRARSIPLILLVFSIFNTLDGQVSRVLIENPPKDPAGKIAVRQKARKQYTYFDNGTLKRKEIYAANLGSVKIWEYWPEGVLRRVWRMTRISTKSEFRVQGLERCYWRTGSLFSQSRYRNGNLDGLSKTYHSNGRISSIGSYKKGNRFGKWRFFDEDGKEILENIDQDDGFEEK